MIDSDLSALIATQCQQYGIAGAAVTLVVGNAPPTTYTVGQRPVSRQPVTPQTLFQAASLTKPVFAYSVMHLYEAGRLDLDTPLNEFYTDPAITTAEGRSITARHVLTHTTGLPNWREEVEQQALIPQTTPGTRYTYSGEAFEYLQRVVEEITGMPLAAYIMQTVLAPLGMTASRMQWGVDATGQELWDADGIAQPTGARTIASAAWSLLTTASDYGRFLQAMVVPPASGAALLPDTLATMLTPSQQVGGHPKLHWGLGWGLQETSNGWCLWHWGGPQNGYTSYAAILPTTQRGVVVLTNSNDGFPACQQIAQAALGVTQPAFAWILPVESWHPEGAGGVNI